MGAENFFHKLAPWLAAGVQFVPGAGPAIAGVITKIAGEHGVQLPSAVEPTVESLGNAVAAMTGNSEAMAALKKQDQDYSLQMQAAGFKNLEDIYALDNEDKANARNREIQVRDKTPEIGFYLLTFGFFAALICLFHFPIPAENKATVYTMIGSLGTVWLASGMYFYGTTRSSGAKDQTIADIAKS